MEPNQTFQDELSPATFRGRSESPTQGQLLSGRRILLVEDSEDNQEIFSFFLEMAGAQLVMVDNGLDAVEQALTGDFDIVLMDIQIPKIDGREATRRIRAGGFKKPIVALTAHAMAEEREACLSAGCNGQLSKPISGTDLVAGVRRFVEEDDDVALGSP